MAAFLVFHSTVTDPEGFQVYARGVPETLAPFGGEIALRGKVAQVVAGRHDHSAIGVLRFPDEGSATGWYDSPAYQALIPVRDAAAEVVVIRYNEP